jgi:hypothetical protein
VVRNDRCDFGYATYTLHRIRPQEVLAIDHQHAVLGPEFIAASVCIERITLPFSINDKSILMLSGFNTYAAGPYPIIMPM